MNPAPVSLLRFRAAMLAVSALMLGGCAGEYGRSHEQSPNSSGGDGAKTLEAHFAQRVQPRLEFCRNCHVPGGIADVEDGRAFMLSPDRAEDLQNLRSSWERLGRNNPVSRLLLLPSGQAPHSGGAPWPQDGEAYRDMAVLLKCFENPQGCSALLGGIGGAGPIAQERPLLGSKRGGHAWFDFCAGKGDSTPLPVDPRALIVPGVNAGKAVFYNAYWKDCHADPDLVGEPAPPKTCGELRTVAAQGETLIKGNGAIGAGYYFGGNGTAGNYTVAEHNTLWQAWGLPERPDNFDQLVAERYGMGLGMERNPYPLPGEDPNTSEGGSGQLPTGLTQLRDRDGRWTGNLGVTCHVCHSGQVGTPADGPGLGALYGNANSLSEFGQIEVDLGGSAAADIPVPVIVGKTRGTNNALALQIITFLLSLDVRPLDPNFIGFAVLSPNGGSLDAPAWWNMGHRPVKFQDGFLAMGALRADLGFFLPGPGPGGFDWIREHARSADTYVMSLKAPAFPGAVNTALAEQGAILFHSKDLWAAADANVLRPAGGNGSCASCHGVYSPRYAHDPAYLETPELEGVASYIVPRDLIATDRWRVDSDSEAAEQYGKKNFFAYPETLNDNPDLDCSTQNRAEIRQGRAPGYLAPPLYGVWATAPYFHNGSVPNVWEVLKPEDRQTIWRRVSTPARPDQFGQVVMGFDTDLQRAYDHDKLGWKYDTLACGEPGATPYLDCSSSDVDPPLLTLLNLLSASNPYFWYVGVGSDRQRYLEERKIYNTRMYGQGNGGHAFTATLTDAERKAIVEYLKTL